MRWLRKRPFYAKIGAKPDDEYAFAALRHTIIRRVEQLKNDMVVQTGRRPRSVYSLKYLAVFAPGRSFAKRDAWMRKAKDRVFEIVSECRTKQPFYVFDDKRHWLERGDGASEF